MDGLAALALAAGRRPPALEAPPTWASWLGRLRCSPSEGATPLPPGPPLRVWAGIWGVGPPCAARLPSSTRIRQALGVSPGPQAVCGTDT